MAFFDANRPELGLHISQYASPEDGIWFRGTAVNRLGTSLGSVRHYAGGKRRAVTWGASDRTTDVTMTLTRLADMETIEAWLDTIVVVRTTRGEVSIGLLSSFTTTGSFDISISWIGGSLSIMQTTDDAILEGERRR